MHLKNYLKVETLLEGFVVYWVAEETGLGRVGYDEVM